MPILEAKQIQAELKRQKVWPVYCFYGPEAMKRRELMKRIHQQLNPNSMNRYRFEASDVTPESIVDQVNSLSLIAGCQWIEVHGAEQWKEASALETLMGPAQSADHLDSILILVAKDLDKRKRFSKILLERAAVVPCEAIADHEKEAWIQYLASRRNQTLPASQVLDLASRDPWSLEIIDQELEKLSLFDHKGSIADLSESFDPQEWIHWFLTKKKQACLSTLNAFVRDPEAALPFLGLLSWNLKQLLLMQSDPKAKISRFAKKKLEGSLRDWPVTRLQATQRCLLELDRSLKQDRIDPLGAWSSFLHQVL